MTNRTKTNFTNIILDSDGNWRHIQVTNQLSGMYKVATAISTSRYLFPPINTTQYQHDKTASYLQNTGRSLRRRRLLQLLQLFRQELVSELDLFHSSITAN